MLDFKERMENENESRDKKYAEMERHFNSSIESLKTGYSFTWVVGINFKTFVQNLQDSKTEIAGITIHTVESALLVEDQCSWFTWVTFAREFTYARKNIQAFVLYSLKLFRLHYQQNNVPPKKGNFGYLRTLTPTN